MDSSRTGLVLAVALTLNACGFVDAGLSSRTETLNRGYDSAQSSNLLRNILRAKEQKPLRFYSISKFIPNQLSDIKIGLPTITFGPAQTPPQRQFVFSGNIADNSASMSFEVDPIETRDFYDAMTEPMSPDILAKLFRLFPREFVYYVAFESVRVSQISNLPSYNEFRNDPQLDAKNVCPPADYQNYDPKLYNPARGDDTTYNPAREVAEGTSHSACDFHKYQYYVARAIKYGATIRSESSAEGPASTRSTNTQTAKPSNGQNAAEKGASQQQASTRNVRFCYDPTLARADVVNELASQSGSVCGGKPSSSGSVAASPITIGWRAADGRVYTINQKIELVPRSPIGLFLYLGHLLQEGVSTAQVQLFTYESTMDGDNRLFTVERTIRTGGCFAEAEDWSGTYCVPNRGAANTKRLFLLLTLLTGLSTSPSDIQSTPTIRVTP